MRFEDHPLSPSKAKRLLRELREQGRILYSKPHALARMRERDITSVDVINVLRGGVVEPGEYENGAWRYRVRTNKFCVVVQFLSHEALLVVTVVRYE